MTIPTRLTPLPTPPQVAYPALLMSQCARQGCFEAIPVFTNPNPNPNPNPNLNPNPNPNPYQAIPVYTTARLLASINVEALARFEGFDVRAGDP